MSNTETDRNTADGSNPKGDEMKSTFIVRFWMFLERNIARILIFFIPFCLALFVGWQFVLWKLPRELRRELDILSMLDYVFILAGALGLCMIVAACRLIRVAKENDARSAMRNLAAIMVVDILITGYLFYFAAMAEMKVDRIYTSENLCLVFKRLDQYHEEHGCYPARQDFQSLLKTLGLADRKDWAYTQRTVFMNFKSAEYLAPTQESGYPYLTIRYRPRLFGKKITYVLRYPMNPEHDLEIYAIREEWDAKRKMGERYDPDAEPFIHGVHFQPVIGCAPDELILQTRKKTDEMISRSQNQTELQPQTEHQPETEHQPPPLPSATT